jgi:hypothetical protein
MKPPLAECGTDCPGERCHVRQGFERAGEDEGVFTMPWTATITYGRPLYEWTEQVCAENPYKYGTEKDAAVPTADKPDF